MKKVLLNHFDRVTKLCLWLAGASAKEAKADLEIPSHTSNPLVPYIRNKNMDDTILVTGGCGYIGCRLVPRLIDLGYRVRVLDAMIFGNFLPEWAMASGSLEVIMGDIRDRGMLEASLKGCGAVVHLAALANDPSADLDPALARAVNRDAVISLAENARAASVRRFVNASTATVYGVREERDVSEEFEHRPITLYGRYKSETDRLLAGMASDDFVTVSLRSATVCGWSPRMRLDLTVNILTLQAVTQGKITVHGGQQMRPNIVIDDLVDAYVTLLKAPAFSVNGRAFNAGGENHSVLEIAGIVRDTVAPEAEIAIEPVYDHRSYHISSRLIRDTLAFNPKLRIRDAAMQVAGAIHDGRIADPENTIHRNVAHMKATIFQ